jgi:hypothetical protein
MSQLDFHIQADIASSIFRVDELLRSGVLSPPNSRHPLFKSAFREVIILVGGLMAKGDRFASRVDCPSPL